MPFRRQPRRRRADTPNSFAHFDVTPQPAASYAIRHYISDLPLRHSAAAGTLRHAAAFSPHDAAEIEDGISAAAAAAITPLYATAAASRIRLR